MQFDRLARVIAAAAIAATPALTVAATTAATSAGAAEIHAAGPQSLSVIEIVGRSADDECCGWPGSTNSGCGFLV
ncbi:hypothetical protein [Hamadaea tsunoensis]|uniref:hypothetical protein n=1 Tax=Hamadaea tsunoensis TaxID=53368 RepID=UPI00041C1D57|nr:hypothetical protein [Hamadaea tsunoensis]